VALSSLASCRENDQPNATEQPGKTSTRKSNDYRVPRAWPTLPVTPEKLDKVLASYIQRPLPKNALTNEDVGPEPKAETLLNLLKGRFRDGVVVSGWPQLVRWIDRKFEAATGDGIDAYLLWGVYHDSRDQHAAFRRVVGPLGISSGTSSPVLVVVESLAADGRWTSVGKREQQGDDQAMAEFWRSASPSAFRQLAARQLKENYTAWKFDYLDEALDLLVTTRGLGNPVMGCNMPSGLQQRVRPTLKQQTEKLRELHCALALRERLAYMSKPHRVAAIWGQAHLGTAGFAEFIPPEAMVIMLRLFGGRPTEHGVAKTLRRRLVLADPVLVPTDNQGRNAFVLLNGQHLAGDVDRVHDRQACPLPPERQRQLHASSTVPGTLRIAGQQITLDDKPRSLRLPADPQPYLFEGNQIAVVGSLQVPEAGWIDLDLEPDKRTVRLTIHSCSPSAGTL